MTEEHENEAAASDVVAADLVINNDRLLAFVGGGAVRIEGKIAEAP